MVTDRSACGSSWSVSVAVGVLRAAIPAGGTAVAVLTRKPVAFAATVPVAVTTMVAPTGTSTPMSMLPVPDAVPQTPPALPLHVHDTPVNAAGNTSWTRAPIALLGPLFVTVIV